MEILNLLNMKETIKPTRMPAIISISKWAPAKILPRETNRAKVRRRAPFFLLKYKVVKAKAKDIAVCVDGNLAPSFKAKKDSSGRETGKKYFVISVIKSAKATENNPFISNPLSLFAKYKNNKATMKIK